MYVIHMYVCIACMHASVHVCLCTSVCACMHSCMYVCMCVCMYVCIVYVCMYVYVSMYVCMYVYMYVCVCVYVCVYVFLYVCMYVCMYVSYNLKRIKIGVVNFTGIANSDVDDTQCILPGRPYGGYAILWNKEIRIPPVQVKSLLKHVCSIMRTLHNNHTLLMICAYFPNDPGTVIYNNAIKLGIVLADIADTLLNVNYEGIILAGDLNCDFTYTTRFVDNVKMFRRNIGLSPLLRKYVD